ncbi:hypothetical protein BDQ17DRAFT_1372675 [Cyathus striatus]|nr:hypothetical protein BDQ17DRAFT_1372675 [Cyathus striatus]
MKACTGPIVREPTLFHEVEWTLWAPIVIRAETGICGSGLYSSTRLHLIGTKRSAGIDYYASLVLLQQTGILDVLLFSSFISLILACNIHSSSFSFIFVILFLFLPKHCAVLKPDCNRLLTYPCKHFTLPLLLLLVRARTISTL